MIKLIGDMPQFKPHMSDVVLITDAVAIHKEAFLDPKKKFYVGRVDYGTCLPEVKNDLVNEALMFMICVITGH